MANNFALGHSRLIAITPVSTPNPPTPPTPLALTEPWTFSHTGSQVTQVTTPAGGEVTYTYQDVWNNGSYVGHLLTGRSQRDLPGGSLRSWTVQREFANCTSGDHHGNRQTASGVTYTYEPSNRFRLNQIGVGAVMTYDANGNLRTGPGGTYGYTPDNQMNTATVGSTVATYVYDTSQWRIRKAVTGQPAVYSLRGSGGGLLTEWVNASPTATVRDYIYAGGRLITIVTTRPSNP